MSEQPFEVPYQLGTGRFQASPGNHKHAGDDSFPVLAGVNLTGSRASGAALLTVIAALVKLGATDNTVA